MRAVPPLLLLLLLPLPLPAQDPEAPEPGPVPIDIVSPGRLVIVPVEGDREGALRRFLDAHERHKSGDTRAALYGYLEFLGMPGRHELPRRYVRTARDRLDALLAELRKRYELALQLYRGDRVKGLAGLERIADEHSALPVGEAARGLVQSDRLRAAIDSARARDRDGQREAAARDLEEAIRALPHALYLYEAKSLLRDLGGPDLIAKEKERRPIRGDSTPERGKRDGDDEDGEPEIEINDG